MILWVLETTIQAINIFFEISLQLHLFDGNLNSDSPYKPRTPAVAFALIYPKFSGPDLLPLSQPSFSALTACLVTRAFLAAKGVFQNFFPL